ncbi:MAG: TetR family transcriptional regulator [Hyphomicrobiales bacterium]|nr:MAG: TetR family transcriptional regulator [Hyphomicrobiales bacterium]
MKQWNKDHPKAALMARKRTDILNAARTQFLDAGYDGSSMESIAKAANVSIMTLYRHAQTKDKLFAAIIASACQPSTAAEQAELEAILTLPLPEALLQSALHMQDTLTSAETIALMRVVISEVDRFPQLAELAYQGFFQRLEGVTATILSLLSETKQFEASDREKLGKLFVNRIVGTQIIRALLGLSGLDANEKLNRAELARDEIMNELPNFLKKIN